MSRTTRRAAGLLVSVPIVMSATVAGPAMPVFAQDAACTVEVWGDEITHLALGKAAEAYTTETGVPVELISVPFSTINSDYETQVAAGGGPDLIIAPGPLDGWVASGIAAPLELGDTLAAFQPAAAAAALVDGQAYMVPLWTENIGLIRNTALVPEAPATMDALIEAGQALVEAGTTELVIAIPMDPEGGNAYLLYPFQTSFGDHWFARNADGSFDYTQPTLDTEAGLAFARALGAWGASGAVSPDVGFDIAVDRFITGKTPFLVTGPWDLPAIKDAGIDYAIDRLPSAGGSPAAPWLGVFGLVLNPKSDCALAATDFATRFMVTPEAQVTLFEVGSYPPANTEAFAQVADDPDVKAWGENGVDAQPLFGDPVASGATWGAIGKTQVAILRGQGDAETLWKEMAAQVAASLAEGGN